MLRAAMTGMSTKFTDPSGAIRDYVPRDSILSMLEEMVGTEPDPNQSQNFMQDLRTALDERAPAYTISGAGGVSIK